MKNPSLRSGWAGVRWRRRHGHFGLVAFCLACVAAVPLQAGRVENTWTPKLLAGPYPTIQDYCRKLPERKIIAATSYGPVRAENNGYVCHSELKIPKNAPYTCPDISFKPTDQKLAEVKLISISIGDMANHWCVLAWRMAAGWFFDELALVMDNERHYEQIVYAQDDGKTQSTGPVAHLRVRYVHTLRNQKAEPRLFCMDSVRLYGVGKSGRLSRIEVDAGELEPCDDFVWGTKSSPPLSRWTFYLREQVLPDGRVEMTPIRPLGKGPGADKYHIAAGIHKLHFP